ncbi:MAG: class I SAM-dependent RNA methyltransferase, partial [Thermoanaerobaculia bacterium]
MQIGEELTIRPEELVAGGDALARADGFPIFISNVFPGDLARVRITEAKKGYARADLVELVEPSADRRLAPCPIAGECGGCDWTALRLDRQLEAKRHILTEALRRIGKIDPATLPPIHIHASPLNYRIRSRLQLDPESGAVGFYAMKSNRVVPLAKECEVVGIETARRFGNAVIPSPAEGEKSGRGMTSWEIDGTVTTDERELTFRVADFTYALSTKSFFQVNRHLLATMLRLVEEHATRVERRHLAIDLYSGVGFFTLPIARQFERVISVEGSPDSHEYAVRNAPANVKSVAAPVESWVQDMPGADFIFLDPPRAGARRNVIDAIGTKAREMICFLSCDPVTFARDASRLIASGWRLATL